MHPRIRRVFIFELSSAIEMQEVWKVLQIVFLILPPLLLYIIVSTGQYHHTSIIQRYWIVVGVGLAELTLFYLVITNFSV
jgi:hypothetical protein